ncbi:hypothetical protein IHJ32_004644 [Escherichia coli]|jgi:hypothetical protein|uniref:Uncharacterized protein n=6 Tax=Enterobacteriaceae TaxID=543 RepID=A0AAF0HRK0_ECOLX|nr:MULTISPECIES: hypothetical protein [Enterobacteriaceae]EAA5483235.1 hypothetical protein [Salmonella enterica subsp. enterica]EAB5872380.1 hypothetical protein [Salmonella enterica subsp. enterica serovar Panama]EBG8292324.1 hypothetical protein [Salmonella enterica subsp. enterica serovar Senftenberg]EBH8363265.1 hypothetical protein [Salmonella enterica subsp. enterica serovar Cerro]EBK1770491.1 hypothetical protein [Salmonella enterica subsp. enterica serovar Newport]EBQ9561900.1 hypoth
MSRSISEEFKDQKINDLLEDYIALEKQIEKTANLIINAIDETPARLDAVLSDKVNKIIQSSIDINKDINIAKSDIRQISDECQSEITKQAINTFSGIKQNFDQIASDHKKQLEILTKSAKPFSIKTAIAICALCTLCLSAAFSGATWYVAQHEKEASLRFYARAFLDMKKITEESMRKLPKSDQQNIKLKLDEIDSRKP